MEMMTLNEQKTQNPQTALETKIQKLIISFTALKEKYDTIKVDYEKALTANIELEDERNQWLNEKSHLEQKIVQLEEQLLARTNEVDNLKEENFELEGITKEVALKIDDLLSQVDLDF